MPAIPTYMQPTAASKARAATRVLPANTRPKVKAQAKTVKQQANRPQAKHQVKTRPGKPQAKHQAPGTPKEEPVTFAPLAVDTVAAVCPDESEQDWDLSLLQNSTLEDDEDTDVTVIKNKLSELDSVALVDASLFAAPVTRVVSTKTSQQSAFVDEATPELSSMSTTMEFPTESFVAIEVSQSSSVWSAPLHDSVMEMKNSIDPGYEIAHTAVSVSASPADASFSALSASALARQFLQVPESDDRIFQQCPEEVQFALSFDESCSLIGEGRLFSPFHSSFLARCRQEKQQQLQEQALPTVAQLLGDITCDPESEDEQQLQEQALPTVAQLLGDITCDPESEDGVMMPERPTARLGFYGQEAESSSDGGLAAVISALEELSVLSDGDSFALDDIITGRAAGPPLPEGMRSLCPRDVYVPKNEGRTVLECLHPKQYKPVVTVSKMPADVWTRKVSRLHFAFA